MPIKRSWSSLWAAAFFAAVGLNLAHAAPLMIIGNDEKLLWDDNGKPIISSAGKDSVLIVDLAEPEIRRHRIEAEGFPYRSGRSPAQEQESGLLKLGHNTALMRCAGETS